MFYFQKVQKKFELKSEKKKNCNRAKPIASPTNYRGNKPTDSHQTKKKPIQSKSPNQIRNFGPYRPWQALVDDRRSDFSKSVHNGTKTLSPFLLTRNCCVFFSFAEISLSWWSLFLFGKGVCSLVNNNSQVYLLTHCVPISVLAT